MAAGDPWTVEFYSDERGREPFRRWVERELSAVKRAAVLAALDQVLERLGPDVCATEWGRMLGGGLFEFRIRHRAEEIDAILQDTPRGRAKRGEDVLLRVFCHAYGRRVVLLLGGYDKGRDSSARRQQSEIDRARDRLADFRSKQTAARRAVKRAGKRSRPEA